MTDDIIGKNVRVVTTGRTGVIVGCETGFVRVSYGDGKRNYRVLAQNIEMLPEISPTPDDDRFHHGAPPGLDCRDAIRSMPARSDHLPEAVAKYISQNNYAVARGMAYHLYGPMATIIIYAPMTHIGVCSVRKFCEAVPDVSGKFYLMSEASPRWAAIVKNWRLICDLMDYECPDWRTNIDQCNLVDALLDDIYDKIGG